MQWARLTTTLLSLLRRCLLTLLLFYSARGGAWAQTIVLGPEGFENTALPTGWTATRSTNSIPLFAPSATDRIAGSRSARVFANNNGSTADSTTLTSPVFTTIQNSVYTVTFCARAKFMKLTANQTGSTGIQLLSDNTGNLTNAANFSFTFTADAATSQIFFTATRNTAGGNEYEMVLDTVQVTGPKVPEINTAYAQLPLTVLLAWD